MTKTNWNRCFRLLVALLVVASLAVPALAVETTEQTIPEEAEVGTTVEASVELTELYDEFEQWQLAGETELTNVTWTVTYYDQTDARIGQESFDGQEFSGATVSVANGTDRVVVQVRGTAPAVDRDEFSYDPPQRFLLMDVDQERSGGTSNDLGSWETHHFTADSDAARDAIDEAAAAVAEAGEPRAASTSLQSAIDAYEAGNFDNAETNAERALTEAEQAQSTQQRNQLLLYGAVGLVAVGLVGGGIYYYRSQQDDYDRLR